jgi:hypothetical protein
MNQNRKELNVVAALLAAVVAGCGGGGGDSAPTTAAAPVAAPTPVVSTPVAPPAPVVVVAPAPAVSVTASLTVPIVTSVPTPTYAVGSEELAAFNLLNAERSRCGFGMLAQNSSLDMAAKSHADWLLRNGSYGHYETPGTPLYTGSEPVTRYVAAGYAASPRLFGSTEVAINGYVRDKQGFGVVGVRGLLAAPYHMLGMMRHDLDVGVSVRSSVDVAEATTDGRQLVIDSGHKYGTEIIGPPSQMFGQAPSPGLIRTYPCEGSTGLFTLLRGEEPTPTPGRNLAASPVGSSVGVVVDAGHTLSIKSAAIAHATTGVNVTLLPLDNYKTNGVTVLFSNEGFITADKPLAAFTPYKVTINGEDNGIAFTKTFNFTTGAAQ